MNIIWSFQNSNERVFIFIFTLSNFSARCSRAESRKESGEQRVRKHDLKKVLKNIEKPDARYTLLRSYIVDTGSSQCVNTERSLYTKNRGRWRGARYLRRLEVSNVTLVCPRRVSLRHIDRRANYDFIVRKNAVLLVESYLELKYDDRPHSSRGFSKD